jgi:hypothetical protein
MLSPRSCRLILLAALLPVACSHDSGKNPPDPDKASPPSPDYGPPVTLTCKSDHSDCRDFVISRLLLPSNTKDADRWALHFGGKSYNQLGNILSALASIGPSTTIQSAIDGMLYQGATIVLARVRAQDFVNDAATQGQTFVGAKTGCCPSAGGDAAKCKGEALQGCFAGTPPHAFAVDDSAVQSSLLTGALSGGNLALTCPQMNINLPLTSAGVMQLDLKTAQLRGLLGTDTISDGALAGTLSRADVQQKLIPNVAQMLDSMLQDPATTSDLKDFLSTLFDRDKDGHITADEVAQSSIKTLLDGDVDTDGDGEMELSLGIGYEAVRAVIQGK